MIKDIKNNITFLCSKLHQPPIPIRMWVYGVKVRITPGEYIFIRQ